MSYVATWLKGDAIVSEEEFEDLRIAQVEVLKHMVEYRERLGADCVKVWNGRATYFKVGIPSTCLPPSISGEPTVASSVSPPMDEEIVLDRAERALAISRELRARLRNDGDGGS